MSAGPTYPRNDLLDALLVALHLQERLDLADGEVLPITKRHHLVKGAEDVKGMSEDLALVQRLAYAADDLGEEVQRVNVLEDVGLLVGDEHHVQLVQGLVDEADIVLLDRRVLGARVGGLGERGEEGFDAGALDVVESSGDDGLAAAGADGRSEDDLEGGVLSVAGRGREAERPGNGPRREGGTDHLDGCSGRVWVFGGSGGGVTGYRGDGESFTFLSAPCSPIAQSRHQSTQWSFGGVGRVSCVVSARCGSGDVGLPAGNLPASDVHQVFHACPLGSLRFRQVGALSLSLSRHPTLSRKRKRRSSRSCQLLLFLIIWTDEK